MNSASVHVVLPDGDEVLAGTISSEGAGTIASTVTFRYDASYLDDPRAYALSPDMPLTLGPLRPAIGRKALGALGDATPDDWGRRVIRASQHPRDEFDYFVAVPDRTRQGALRVHDGERYLGDRVHAAADVHKLDRIVKAARAVEEGTESDEDLRILVSAGTSAGGARPKANVTIDGELWIAKFSRDTEHNDPMAWEATALELAKRAGSAVPDFRISRGGDGDAILLTRRFDRDGDRRIGYMSAHSLVEKQEQSPASYAFLAEVLRIHSASPRADLHALYRRVATNLMVGNVDDHFRNHGVLREAAGWRLSPAFDIEPNPQASRVEATPLTEGGSGFDRDIRELVALHDAFDLTKAQAASIVREVAEQTRDWREVAVSFGISPDTFRVREKVMDGPNRDRALEFPLESSAPARAGPTRGKTTPRSNAGSFRPQTNTAPEIEL